MLLSKIKLAVVSENTDGFFAENKPAYDLFDPTDLSLIGAIPFDLIIIDARDCRNFPAPEIVSVELSGANISVS